MTPLILIVEDQPLHAKLFRDILLAGGYRAIVAGNAAEAVRMTPHARPDAILLDILLPDVDGREVIAAMRADPATQAVAILAISALADRFMAEGCLAAGADAFLAKPVGMAELVDRIGALIPHRQ